MRLSVRLCCSLVLAVASVSLLFGLYQARVGIHGLERELEQHAMILAQSLEKSAEPLVGSRSRGELKRLVDRFQNFQKLAGVAIYDKTGNALAYTRELAPQFTAKPPTAVLETQEGGGHGQFVPTNGGRMHVFALPIKTDSDILGAVAVFHDASYIDWQMSGMWRSGLKVTRPRR